MNILRGEWTKQLVTGTLIGTMGFWSTIGFAQQFGTTIWVEQGDLEKPNWWQDRSVLDDDPAANKSPVNTGQLKWITHQLHQELSTLLPEQANLFPLSAIDPSKPESFKATQPYEAGYDTWKEGNKKIVTLGQLKNCALKFYNELNTISPDWVLDQLQSSGLITQDTHYWQVGVNASYTDGGYYPWDPATPVAENKKPANIGQLKSVFALRLRESKDDDLLPDIFEHALIKYHPDFANETLDSITWNPGDANVSIREVDANNNEILSHTGIFAPNIGGRTGSNLCATALLSEHEPVGSVGGSFQVGGDGAANYSIPIDIPKGTSGVEPRIALSYSSNSGNGSAGVGFNLTGFQRITRGATSRAKEGFVDPVDFDENDRFFFDGELLIAVEDKLGNPAEADDYGKDGTIYQTEKNSFARIISHGQLGSGPHHWTVQTKAGLTIEMGNCDTSCVNNPGGKGALVWNVNRVYDNVGNYYVVNYERDADGGALDYRVANVKYTGNGAMVPYNEVKFVWEDRPDVRTSYICGIKVTNEKRLQEIHLYSSQTLLSRYSIDYIDEGYSTFVEYGNEYPLKLSMLQKVTRFNTNGDSLPPTIFNWSAPGLATFNSESGPPTYIHDDRHGIAQRDISRLKFADFNGDGRVDVFRANGWGTDSTSIWLSQSDGSFVEVAGPPASVYNADVSAELDLSRLEIMDMNGDGLSDIYRIEGWGTAHNNLDSIWLSQGDGTFVMQQGPPTYVHDDRHGIAQRDISRLKFADFNGDGRVDIFRANGWGTESTSVWLSQSDGSFIEVAGPPAYVHNGDVPAEIDISRLEIMDVNGDGLSDIYRIEGWGNAQNDSIWLSQGDGTFVMQQGPPTYIHDDRHGIAQRDISRLKFADFNGDGRVDVFRANGWGSESTSVWLSQSDGSFAEVAGPLAFVNNSDTAAAIDLSRLQIMDVNGDGLSDIYRIEGWGAAYNNLDSIWLSQGDGTFVMQQGPPTYIHDDRHGIAQRDISRLKFADFNGDGRVDVFRANGWGTESTSIWLSQSDESFVEVTGPPAYVHDGDVPAEIDISRLEIMDMNGDGLSDIYRIEGWGNAQNDSIWLNQIKTQRLTSVVDGLGAEIRVEYKRLSDSSEDNYGRKIYTKAPYSAQDLQNGVIRANGGGYVVSRYAEQDGLGGYRWTRQYYGPRRVDRNNEEDLGFEWIEMVGEQRGHGSITTFSQEYPYQGQPLESISYIPNPDGISAPLITGKQTYTYAKHADQLGIGGPIQFTYQQKSKTFDYAIEAPHALVTSLTGNSYLGRELSWTETHNEQFNEWGDLIRSSSTNSEGFGTLNINEYFPPVTTKTADHMTSKWILGRLKKSAVTKTGPTGYDPITKTSEFTYYTEGPHCGMLKTEVAEPLNPLSVTKSYEYDQWGNTVKTTLTANNNDQLARNTYMEYDPTGRFPVKEWNDLNHTVTHNYDHARSLLLSSAGVNGLTTRHYYDAWGTKILTRHPDGTETTEITRYATPADTSAGVGLAANQGIVFIRKAQTTGAPASTAFIDAQGRVLMSCAETFDGRFAYTRMDYDIYGREYRKSAPFFANDSMYWTTVEFDAVDRAVKTTSPDGSIQWVKYDGFTSEVCNAIDQRQFSTNNSQGWLVETKDNDGNITTFEYTVDGKPKLTTAPGGHITETSLDIFGQKTYMNDSDLGESWTTYYAFGEVKQTKDAKGSTVDFTYDRLGRQKTRVVKDASLNIESTTTWTYDTAPGAGLGKVHTVSVKDGGNTETYFSSVVYDALGRDIESTATHHGESFVSNTTFDSIGRVLTETDAGGLTIMHEYNDRGFETGIRDYHTGELYWQPLEYDASARLIRERLGNGVENVSVYDQERGTMLRSASKKGTLTPAEVAVADVNAAASNPLTGALQDMQYTWDAIGNVHKRIDHRKSLTENFSYDSLNRLDWSQVVGKTKLHYEYDLTGNITSKANVGTYTYDTNRKHVLKSLAGFNGTNRTYEYDANGALTIEKRNGQNYREIVWAAHSKVKSISLNGGPRVVKVDGTDIHAAGNTIVNFDYDSGFNRTQKVTERDGLKRETTLYLGSYERITTESRSTSGDNYAEDKVEHRHSIGGLVLKKSIDEGGSTSEETVYFLKDHLGSLVASLDDQGVAKEYYSFDAWGSRRNAETWTDSSYDKFTKVETTNRGYTGHEMLDEIGLVHMNGRIYDSELGRFFNGDDYIQAPENSQNYNRYSYVLNNPLSYTDPSGHFFLKKLIKKKFSKLNRIRKKVQKSVQKWLAENQWAAIVISVILTVVTFGAAGGFAALASASANGLSAATATALAIAGAAAGAVGGAFNAFAAGGGFGDILKGAIVGGITGAVSGYLGGQNLDLLTRAVANGIVGGTVNVAMGGKFGDGFISAAAATVVGNYLPGFGDAGSPAHAVSKAINAAVIGGAVSELGGGKFATGAVTAAFQNLVHSYGERLYVRNVQHPGIKIVKNSDGVDDYIDNTEGSWGTVIIKPNLAKHTTSGGASKPKVDILGGIKAFYNSVFGGADTMTAMASGVPMSTGMGSPAVRQIVADGMPVKLFDNIRPSWRPSGVRLKDLLYPSKTGFTGVNNKALDFVVDKTGKLHMGRSHAYLSGGDAVQAAGRAHFNNGKLIGLDNGSGHYLPHGVNSSIVEGAFNSAGYKASGLYKETFKPKL